MVGGDKLFISSHFFPFFGQSIYFSGNFRRFNLNAEKGKLFTDEIARFSGVGGRKREYILLKRSDKIKNGRQRFRRVEIVVHRFFKLLGELFFVKAPAKPLPDFPFFRQRRLFQKFSDGLKGIFGGSGERFLVVKRGAVMTGGDKQPQRGGAVIFEKIADGDEISRAFGHFFAADEQEAGVHPDFHERIGLGRRPDSRQDAQPDPRVRFRVYR